MVGGSRAAVDATGSGGTGGTAGTAGTGACPKPLVLLSKTHTFHRKYLLYVLKLMFSWKIVVLLSETIVFIENRTQGSPR